MARVWIRNMIESVSRCVRYDVRIGRTSKRAHTDIRIPFPDPSYLRLTGKCVCLYLAGYIGNLFVESSVDEEHEHPLHADLTHGREKLCSFGTRFPVPRKRYGL